MWSVRGLGVSEITGLGFRGLGFRVLGLGFLLYRDGFLDQPCIEH